MRKNASFLAAVSFCLLLLATGCDMGPRIQGIGPVVPQTRTVGSFTGVELRSDADVVVSQGDEPGVKVDGQQNILDLLKTDVHGETLRIEYAGNPNIGSHEPVKVYITTPTLREANISGSGSISSAAVWKSESFRGTISGSGNLDFRVTGTRDLHVNISGSGNVKLAGDAERCTLGISGSGDMRAYDLAAQDVEVSISGSGSADVSAARTLSGDISGSGSVHYRGRPTVTCHVSGAGTVNPAR